MGDNKVVLGNGVAMYNFTLTNTGAYSLFKFDNYVLQDLRWYQLELRAVWTTYLTCEIAIN